MNKHFRQKPSASNSSFKSRSNPSSSNSSSNLRPNSQSKNSSNRLEVPRSHRAVIGLHSIREVLKVRPKAIQTLWIRQKWEDSKDLRELHDLIRPFAKKIEIVTENRLDALSSHNQGLAITVNEAPVANRDQLMEKKTSKIILLDGIEDPHNLGAIVRTAWLMGVDLVLVPQDRAVGLTPTMHKVASGGAEHVPVEFCANFSSVLEDYKKNGYWVYGLSHKAKSTIFDLKLPEKVIWAIGAEDRGLRTTTEKLCDELASIPQVAADASYNASVAAAIALSETQRQHLRL